MRRGLAVAALALILPATARAAPFGELPSRLPRDGVSCLQATGEPGTLAHNEGLDRGFPSSTTLLRADATGLRPGAALPAAPYGSCNQLALRPNGTGVAAWFFADEPGESGIRVALRETGTWSAPAELAGDAEGVAVDSIAVGVSDAGAAVVATLADTARGLVVTATRRAPGGGLGATETIMSVPDFAGTTELRAGVTAAGETVVAWSFRARQNAPRQLWATYATQGGAFQAPVRLGAPRGPFALAVGDGGQAVVAFTADKRMRVASREPGAGFGVAQPVGVADDPLRVSPAAAVRADGAAIVGWVNFLDGAARAVTRNTAPAPFGGQLNLARRISFGFDRALLDESINPEFRDGDFDFDNQFELVGATFAGERALLAWTAMTRRDGVFATAPSVAALAPGGGATEIHALGAGLRDVYSVAPLVTADGMGAAAWVEEGPPGNSSATIGKSSLHLAVEGAASAAEPPAPRLRVGAPEQRVLRADDALVLPVTCSAACEVRVSTAEGVFDATRDLTLRRAGTDTVRLARESRPIARLDGKPVPVYVRWGAPGTAHPRSRTVMVRLRRPPSPPAPRIEGVRARRAGDDVVVTWRTDRAADHKDFHAYATAERGGDALRVAVAVGSGRRFRARIRDVADARFATVLGDIRRATVEIK